MSISIADCPSKIRIFCMRWLHHQSNLRCYSWSLCW